MKRFKHEKIPQTNGGVAKSAKATQPKAAPVANPAAKQAEPLTNTEADSDSAQPQASFALPSTVLSDQPNVDTSGSLFSMKQFDADRDLPIVYSEQYNMALAGIELLHQFDTKKYQKLATLLNALFLDTKFARVLQCPAAQDEDPDSVVQPRQLKFMAPNRPVNQSELALHHLSEYIESVNSYKSVVARITETWLINMVPQTAIESRLLTPIKYQVAGTIFAAHLALQHGWAINLGGGFHQSSSNSGETFCIFSDVLITMKYIWRKHPLQKIMIIDLDAHQATGVEKDIAELSAKRRKMVFMLDIFNGTIHPPDTRADKGIDIKVELGRFTGDETYLIKLKESLASAFKQFTPTLIIYIAGQDILLKDQLGLMNISDKGLKKRDRMVFTWATEKLKCPIAMLLGGGYLARGAKVQAESIRYLYSKGLIWGGHRSSSQRTLTRPRNAPKDGSRTNS